MTNLTIVEQKKIKGGAINVWTVLGLGAFITFIIGFFDGFIHPIKCS